MKSWKFLLSHLLGDFQAVSLKEPLSNREQISLKDVIYQEISNSSESITEVDIANHKEKLDEIEELKTEVENYKNQNEEGILNEKIEELTEEIKKKSIEIRGRKALY